MKKNVMTAIVSGAMVGCLAIGGTFAYLTANSGTVKNTFTGSMGMKVAVTENTSKDAQGYKDKQYKFDETGLTADSTNTEYTTGKKYAGDADGGITYTNVVPGAKIDKDVDVVVDENETDSFVFVHVTGLDQADKLATTSFSQVDGTWKLIKADDGKTQDGIYALYNGNDLKVVSSKDNDVTLNVFDTIEVLTTATTEEVTVEKDDGTTEKVQQIVIAPISVKAMTVQANGVSDSDAIKTVTDSNF